jgi:hypothetical protein
MSLAHPQKLGIYSCKMQCELIEGGGAVDLIWIPPGIVAVMHAGQDVVQALRVESTGHNVPE